MQEGKIENFGEKEKQESKSPLMAGLSGDAPSKIRKRPPKTQKGPKGPYEYSALELMRMTSEFIWLKLFLRLGFAIGVLLIMMLGAWLLSRGSILTGIGILVVTFIAIPTMNWIVNRWFGHMARLGHVAAIVEIVKAGHPPDGGMLAFGNKAVSEKFVQAQMFFVLDGLIKQAVSQLQNGVGWVFTMFGGYVPNSIKGLSKHVVKLALIYVDECCLAWIFWKGDSQGDFKSAADGVVIYFQNWQSLLVAALKTAIISQAFIWGGSFLLFLIVSPFVSGVWSLLMFAFILLIMLSVKYAFVDTWVFINMLNSYMQIAPGTEIRFDIYNKLCGMSEAFRKLFSKIDKKDLKDVPKGPGTYQDYVRLGSLDEGLVMGKDFNQVGQGSRKVNRAIQINRGREDITFCGTCGSRNPSTVKFCGDCGDSI